MRIVVGLDETGTETQLCDGWCYFGLMEDHVDKFNKEADAIRTKYGLNVFHARNYDSEHFSAYLEFLQLIEKSTVDSPVSICSTYLYRNDWNAKLHSFAERVYDEAADKVGVSNPQATKVAKKFLPPLMSLIKIGKDIGNDNEFEVHFDSDNVKDQIDSHSLHYSTEIAITLRRTLEIFANNYRNIHFSDAPSIVATDIQVLDDEKSNIIQAADVIGNFSNNYLFKALGSTSKGRVEKAEIFDSVFGKHLSNIQIPEKVRINGSNDLELLGAAAALSFIFGRY